MSLIAFFKTNNPDLSGGAIEEQINLLLPSKLIPCEVADAPSTIPLDACLYIYFIFRFGRMLEMYQSR